MSKVNVTINLQPEILEWAIKKSKELGIGKSTFLKIVLKDAYDREKK